MVTSPIKLNISMFKMIVITHTYLLHLACFLPCHLIILSKFNLMSWNFAKKHDLVYQEKHGLTAIIDVFKALQEYGQTWYEAWESTK